ncbi:hypothetical protein BU23DRAFT_231247 [Bimuria novae-zelandiae CBS 107.79]|uniref:Uncharacterized protein n=1 Tax=Bimuria novae-zelandiae CBS 107.79 TaxID=1447943 RepID=A0A6A5UZH7_9PLEO|nr:hypothetical protein BU23DRAFT_231247 [Bimuria novae-zelandiae CBS 107.79]
MTFRPTSKKARRIYHVSQPTDYRPCPTQPQPHPQQTTDTTNNVRSDTDAGTSGRSSSDGMPRNPNSSTSATQMSTAAPSPRVSATPPTGTKKNEIQAREQAATTQQSSGATSRKPTGTVDILLRSMRRK